MKQLFLLLFYIMPMLGILAQDSTDEFINETKVDPSFIWGEGHGSTIDEAKKTALNDLACQISVSLQSHSQLDQEAENNGGNTSYSSKFQNRISTYSNATLTDVSYLPKKNKTDWYVFAYVDRKKVDEIFDLRRKKTNTFINEAFTALEDGRVNIALRNLYWALTLVNSMQHPDKEVYNYEGEDKMLTVWLPDMIEETLKGLSVNIAEYKDNNVTLFFKAGDQPVKSLDFEYWDGQQWSMPQRVNNGKCSIQLLPGSDPSALTVRYQYKYDGRQYGDELRSVVDLFPGREMQNSETCLCTNSSGTFKSMVSKDAAKELTNTVIETNDIGIQGLSDKDKKEYNKAIERVVEAVSNNKYETVRSLFTDEGWDMMTRLLHYGKARVLSRQSYDFYNLYDGRVCCRSITMTFTFPNNYKTFTEEVVFTFDDTKRIEGVTFGLGRDAKDTVFEKGKLAEWDPQSMLTIVDFLENYKTAFALKRIDYIESVFDDNAYIVTGHVLKKAPKTSENIKLNMTYEDVELTQYTKKQYIERLRKVFNNNEYINLQFSDNEVVHMGKGGELYAIQLHQDYFSSTYGDTGYLLLEVDINDPKQPMIMVRIWQPERIHDLHPNDDIRDRHFGLYGPGDLR